MLYQFQTLNLQWRARSVHNQQIIQSNKHAILLGFGDKLANIRLEVHLEIRHNGVFPTSHVSFGPPKNKRECPLCLIYCISSMCKWFQGMHLSQMRLSSVHPLRNFLQKFSRASLKVRGERGRGWTAQKFSSARISRSKIFKHEINEDKESHGQNVSM